MSIVNIPDNDNMKGGQKEHRVTGMTIEGSLETVRSELATGINLYKCQKCGCMESGLANLSAALSSIGTPEASALTQDLTTWRRSMRAVQYSCLGCDYCYPAIAQNAFAQAFPTAAPIEDLSCEFKVREAEWPAIVGEYFVLDRTGPVAVSTLASSDLAETLAQRKSVGLALVGKTETENIGIDKVIKNIITNRSLQYLILAGADPKGHAPGKTILALVENGVDENRRVIGSPGKRPILRNVSTAEIDAFRKQVQVIDLIGCESADEIAARVEALSPKEPVPCG